MPRLLDKYRNDITLEMMKVFNYKNNLQVPQIEKIVINMGIGEGAHDIKIVEGLMVDLSKITGQKPVITRAKKAISNFKIRDGNAVGCKVTLRKAIMYEFLDRLISLALPRIRDFSGLSNESFDERGNYSFGISDQTIFPEIELDKIQQAQGMDISIAISKGSKKESQELLRLFGMPFKS